MSRQTHRKNLQPICFGNHQEPIFYDDLLGHCAISGPIPADSINAALLLLAQHIASGGNFLYFMHDTSSVDRTAKLLAITGLSANRHHLHHLYISPKKPLKPFFILPFFSGQASLVVSPQSDSATDSSEGDFRTVLTASLNLLTLKLTRDAPYTDVPRLIFIECADLIPDRLLSDVLSRAKMAGVSVILMLQSPLEKPMAIKNSNLHILLPDPSDTAADFWQSLAGIPIDRSSITSGQAFVFTQKGYASSPIKRDWTPFRVPQSVLN